jgi:mycothiol synthase
MKRSDDEKLIHDKLQVREPAIADESAALALVFAHLPPAELSRRMEDVLARLHDGSVMLSGGYAGGRLVTAALVQLHLGHTADVWPPRISEHQPREIVRELMSAVDAELAGRDVSSAQVLLETDTGRDAELLEELGYHRVANLLYLVSLAGQFPTSQPSDGLEYVAYSPVEHERFAAIVERTYVESLDCPRSDRADCIDGILARYRGTGVFDPARWLIAIRAGVDVGCLLLSDYPSENQWELIYMGVVSEARGHGHGLAMVRHAQWLARQAGRDRMTLAVDDENAPAIAVYAAAGFIAWDHRSAFVRNL